MLRRVDLSRTRGEVKWESPQYKKSPGARPGPAVVRQSVSVRDASRMTPQSAQAAFFNALLKLSLIGSAVSVATFWACSESSLACAVMVSNCLRI